MPEHVHLLIRPLHPSCKTASILADIKRPVGQQDISYLVQHRSDFLKQLTIHNRNRTYRRFWQAGAGQDHNVYDPRTAHHIVEYVHNNPIRRGLAESPEDWPWSSAADWMGKEDVPIRIDRTLPGITQLPSTGHCS